MPNIPLNQIYYGPPGTGKTYHTIQMSLEILGIELAGKNRQEIKEIFDRKLSEGRIVFTTFHQSLSYEDFIEGIKPYTRDGQISYSVEPGIFKAICDKINKSGITESPYLTTKYIHPNFTKIYPVYLSKLNEILLDPLCVEPFYFKSRKTKVRLLKIVDSSLVVQEEKTGIIENISPEKIERIYDKFNDPEEIRNIVIQLSGDGDVSIEWTTADFAVFISLKEYEATKKIQYKRSTNNEKDNYVLIIDEINRGNISQIFGELITLLEEDKRIGKPEAIRITLPYSKEKFGVPYNLYLIGTMNTADRSIEALDTAIRRRFHFLEMPSNPDLLSDEGLMGVEGKMVPISLKKLLWVINERIEALLDKDHSIGHSYFLGIQTTEDLKVVFQNKILPLLQEYFFGDLGKIGLILGDHFLESSTWDHVVRFGKFRDYDPSSLEDRTLYRLVRLSKMDLTAFEKAVLSIFEFNE